LVVVVVVVIFMPVINL